MDEPRESVLDTLKEQIRQQIPGIPENVCDQLVTLWPFQVVTSNGISKKQGQIIEMASFQDPNTQVKYNAVVCMLGERKFCLCLHVFLQDEVHIVVERTPASAIQFLCTKIPLPEHTRRMMEVYIRRYIPLKELCEKFITA